MTTKTDPVGSIAELFAEWRELQAQVDQPAAEERMGTDRYSAVIDRLGALEQTMLVVPVNTPLDFVRVAVAVTSRGVFDIGAGKGHQLWADAERLIEAGATAEN